MPLPVPLLPPVTVIHDALLAAVHAHVVDDEVTLAVPVVAPDDGDALVTGSENVHVGGPPEPGTLMYTSSNLYVSASVFVSFTPPHVGLNWNSTKQPLEGNVMFE